MNNLSENEDLATRIRQIVAEALARPLADVGIESLLIGDLGAESLDFLDIVFKLERSFGIQITRGEMENAARGDMTDDDFAPGGVIGEQGLARLRELMPDAAGRIQPGLRPAQILTLFSVRTLMHIVTAKTKTQANEVIT